MFLKCFQSIFNAKVIHFDVEGICNIKKYQNYLFLNKLKGGNIKQVEGQFFIEIDFLANKSLINLIPM